MMIKTIEQVHDAGLDHTYVPGENLSKVYHYSMLFFVFLLPISRASISLSFFWYVALFIFGGKQLAAVKAMWSYPALRWMAAFVVSAWVSYYWSTNQTEALNIMRLYGYWLIIPILAVNLRKRNLNGYINAFLAGMLVSEVASYGAFLGFWQYRGMTPEYPVPYMYHIHYSVFLAVTAVVLLNRVMSGSYGKYTRLMMLLFLLATVGDLLISPGRTGQIAFLIALVVFVLMRYRKMINRIVLAFVVISSIMLMFYINVDGFRQRINMISSDLIKLEQHDFNTSLGIRAAFWILTADVIKQYPVFGVGAGDYSQIASELISRNNYNFDSDVVGWCISNHYHNQYLMVIVQQGIVGLGLMLGFMIALFRTKISDSEYKNTSILFIVIYAAAFMAEPLWFVQFPIGLFMLFVVITLVASGRDDQEYRK